MPSFGSYPADTAPAATDLFLVKQGAATKRMTLDQVRNVDWFNVTDYGAVGDTVTDNWAAIQGLITSAPPWSTIFIPYGTFLVSQPLIVPTPKALTFLSVRATATAFPFENTGGRLLGFFEGPMLQMGPCNGGGVYGLSINNDEHGIWLDSTTYTVIRDVQINCQQTGIYMVNGSGGMIDAPVLTGHNDAASVGIAIDGGGVVTQPDVTSFGTGMKIWSIGPRVLGGRFENNRVGLKLGLNYVDADHATSGVYAGIGFEANDTAIQIHHATGCVFVSCNGIGSEIAPSGDSAYAFDIPGYLDYSVVEACVFGGRFTGAAFHSAANPHAGLAFRACLGTNDIGPGWAMTNLGDTQFSQCNNPGGGQRIVYGAAAPTTGPAVVGDLVYNTAPAAGGTIGWVCTTAGTPGTWKTFGAITA